MQERPHQQPRLDDFSDSLGRGGHLKHTEQACALLAVPTTAPGFGWFSNIETLMTPLCNELLQPIDAQQRRQKHDVPTLLTNNHDDSPQAIREAALAADLITA